MKGNDLSAKGEGRRGNKRGQRAKGNEKEKVKVKRKWDSVKGEGEMEKRK